jgi:cell division protein FtsX
VRILLAEAMMTGLFGALAGMAAATLLFFPFQAYIRSLVSLPFLLPPVETILIVAALSFLISFVIGPLSALYAAIRLGKSEIDVSIREGE